MSENEAELQRSLNLISQSYQTYSIIREATINRAFQNIDRELQLKTICISEIVPEEWFGNPAICPEPFFYDMGRNLAIAEENYLLRIIKESITRREEINESQINIRNLLSRFVQMNDIQPVLFIPAELTRLLINELDVMEFRDNREFLRISSNVNAQVYVTSKYVDLTDIILLNKTFGTWIYANGNFTNSLSIRIDHIEQNLLKITARINVFYNINRPDEGLLIHLLDT